MQGNGIDRSENIRLKMGVPFLRLSRYEIDPQVARLVPEELCRRHRLIPILRNPEHIIVAMADPIEEEALRLVERQVGVPVRAVVGTESEIKEAIDRFFGPDRGIAEPSKRWWADFFLESQLLTRDQLDQAIAIQKETGKPFEKVLYGLGLIPEKTLLNVLSIHYKVPHLDLSQVDIPPVLAEVLPEHLAYHHGVVPVSLEGKTLTLAVDSPPPMVTLDEISLASGRNLKFVLSSPSQIQTSLVRLYSKAQGIPEEEVLSYLLQEGYINQVHLAEARGWAEKSKKRVLGTLVQLGYLSREDLDQVLSLKFGFPIIDLDLFPVDRRALDLVSPAVAQGLDLLPIALGPNELIVAMDDPTRTDVIRDLRSVLGRNVRVVVAEESAIVEGLTRYYQEPGQVAPSPPTARPKEEVRLPEIERVSPEREAIPSDLVAPVTAEPSRPRSNLFSWVEGKGLSTSIGFLSYLAEKGLLSEEEALELLNRHINFQASLLTLLVDGERISAKEFAQRASDFSGMMYYDLTPFPNDEGRVVDPVDHEIAASFPREAAVGLKVLPLGELNGRVLLAVADPTDSLSLYLAKKLIRKDVVPVVAPVDQILQALGRIFPEQEIRGVEPREERRVRLDLVLGEEKLPVVLLVQDDSLDLEIISRALINAGYRVIPCRDGAQALAKLNSIEPDAVVTALEIPFINGIELTQEVRERKGISHIPVIMLTSIEAEDQMVKAFSAGVDEYLVKPFNPRELILRLKAMLARTKSGNPLSNRNSEQPL
ncbi:two-component system, OmpR family, phosphate regulon response regulator PhoB [Candidatus Hakubella thermalkaliphila]|uniref:Two-component system, OmpR family, phosphate regulon response regulator PhoB n=1 Tax=Candidatus Hakubella thermalkaliphila TaxID=2754717 RepID=A0A6V8P1U4_9ACTN|nr:response regulator [Candidatus Hakubella thermalkaliphila]GFP24756.1 two-component system, OmpR family, phosphate regulon response regulator PhoB [Candidatus Hakubella thermalkaliphila]GFP27540.1 two-component system, OmpR family, phosphate regulon response regulator PhoB [Candidatus Hakubella thermalkaliphila]GFP34920.1 two-component system, OmpR family, phosphate regulon response regulator PhoB [Candidatus Hakubella thermalkaliphila]